MATLLDTINIVVDRLEFLQPYYLRKSSALLRLSVIKA